MKIFLSVAAVLARLFGLGDVNWLARKGERQGLIAVLGGNIGVQVLSFVVVLRTMVLGTGSAVAPGVIIDVVLGSGFAYFLMKA